MEGLYGLLVELAYGIFDVRRYGAIGNNIIDDTAAIQNAITACAAAGGGIVLFPPGIYKTSAPLLVVSDKVTLVGSGPGVPYNPTGGTLGPCVLYPTGAAVFANSAVVRLSQGAGATRSLWGVGVRNLAIAGYNLPANCDGIYGEITESRIDDNYIAGVTGKGIHLEGFATDGWNNHIERNHVQGCGGDAYYFGPQAPDNFLTGNTCYAVGGNGVNAVAPGIKIEGNHILNCTGNAITGTPYDVKIFDNRIEDCNGGIYLVGTVGLGGFQIVGNKIWNCSIAADNTTDSINITSNVAIHGGMIEGNVFYTNAGATNGGGAGAKNRARYHINIASANVIDVSIGSNSYLGFDNAVRSYGTAAINNQGTRTTIASIPLAASAVAASHTGDLVETALASITVPGGLMGANGRLRIITTWTIPNNADNKAMRVRLGGIGGTQFFAQTLTAAAANKALTEIANRGAQNAQVGGPSNSIGLGSSTSANVVGALDTSQDQVLAITGALAVAADTITLESYSVEVFPG